MTLIDSVKLVSAASAMPEAESLAVQASATLAACQSPSAGAQTTSGAVSSTTLISPPPSAATWACVAAIVARSVAAAQPVVRP